MYCKHCGAQLDDNAKFCIQCGAAIGSNDSVGYSNPDPVPVMPYAQTSRAKQTAPVKKPIYKKWWFWVIVVLLMLSVISRLGSKGGDVDNSRSVVTADNSAADTETVTPRPTTKPTPRPTVKPTAAPEEEAMAEEPEEPEAEQEEEPEPTPVPRKTVTLSNGLYVVGEDIMPGKYQVTCLNTEGDSFSDAYSSLGGMFESFGENDEAEMMGAMGDLMRTVSWAYVEIVGDYGDVLKSVDLKKGESTQITLEEGTALKISDGECELVPD